MTYSLIFRDDQGHEVEIAKIAAQTVVTKTVFVCPKEGALTGIAIEMLQDAFNRAGVYAIVCNLPMDLYQVKTTED